MNAAVGAGNDGIQVVQGDIVIAHRSNDHDLEPPAPQGGVERMAIPTVKAARRRGKGREVGRVPLSPQAQVRGSTPQRKQQDAPVASNKVSG